ncbi:hypothetical protein BGK67_31370 [Streptomyces subrutilus]|uniref:Uncharacterized protein n=1 Tax=Streptomyces subrutilus TaxID=36818 RepID=A0A1E5Q0B5_9ACTN|nr:hypothetical protein BGK67_31370 [Streptomyces subrutilus]
MPDWIAADRGQQGPVVLEHGGVEGLVGSGEMVPHGAFRVADHGVWVLERVAGHVAVDGGVGDGGVVFVQQLLPDEPHGGELADVGGGVVVEDGVGGGADTDFGRTHDGGALLSGRR